MKDGYRYFAVHATDEHGIPNADVSSHFRVFPLESLSGLPTGRYVEFWNGMAWQGSFIQPFARHLDDVLVSGGAVRELMNEKELPRA